MVVVVNNCGVSNVPLFRFAVKGSDLTAKDWSTKFSLQTECELAVDAFNPNLSEWESFIEPWRVTVTGEREDEFSPQKYKVHSKDVLDVTLSYATAEMLQQDMDTWMADLWRQGTNRITREVFAPFVVHNYLGIPVSFVSSHAPDSQPIMIQPGDEKEWTPPENNASSSVSLSRGLSVIFENDLFTRVDNIPFDQIGHHFATLSPPMKRISYRMACDVAWKSGRKHVTLRSSALFKNETSFDIEVKGKAGEDSPWELRENMITIKGNDMRAVGLPLCHFGEFYMRPRLPEGAEVAWAGPITWKGLLGTKDAIQTCSPVRGATDSRSFVFRMAVCLNCALFILCSC